MKFYSLDEIADMYGAPKTTTWRHIEKLKEEKKFKKTAVGKYHNENDVKLLSALLNFEFKPRQKKAA